MRANDLTVVRRLDLFAGMDEENFEELMQAAYLQRFPPQVQLITEGDPADFLHVMVEGTVELFARANGRETTMEMVRPVSTFILAAVLKEAVYLMSGRTTEKSRILMIPSENIHMIFEKDAAFARAMVRELADCYRSVVKSLKNHKLRAAAERLANYLLHEHHKQGETGRVILPLDKKTLAALLGMTPENLSRAFGAMQAYGVEVNGRNIQLTKLQDLRILAKPTILIDDPST